MLTLGVDLAADPKKTGTCWIRWEQGRAEVFKASLGADDDALVAAFPRADKVGIDVPFGWPDAFVEAIAAHRDGREWPTVSGDRLRYRKTDRHTRATVGLPPLSVSTDRIGVTTFRAAGLLFKLALQGARVDRSGGGRLAEVYPAAALKRWGLRFRGYKGRAGQYREARRGMLCALETMSRWLTLPDEVRDACHESDDVLDALIAAMVARAAVVGLCEPIPVDLFETVCREGWIQLPVLGSLPRLCLAESVRCDSAGAPSNSKQSDLGL